MGTVESLLLPEPFPMDEFCGRGFFGRNEPLVDWIDNLLHSERETMMAIDTKCCSVCGTYRGHNDFPDVPCTICTSVGTTDFEEKNNRLKLILKTVSDDLANLLSLYNQPVPQLVPSQIPPINQKEFDSLRLNLVVQETRVAELTDDLAKNKAWTEREISTFTDQEKQLRARLQEVKEGYDKYVTEATRKIRSMTEELAKEKMTPKLTQGPELRKNLAWLVSERNTLSRQLSDLSRILERMEGFLDYCVAQKTVTDHRWQQAIIDIRTQVKAFIFSGNKYYAPEYDDMVYQVQIAKRALDEVLGRVVFNHTDPNIAMIGIQQVVNDALKEMEPKPVKKVPYPQINDGADVWAAFFKSA